MTGWRVHAWVLMGNHYHLFIETPEANLVAGMSWLQNTVTRRYNVRHMAWGRLFGDRYKAILVDGADTYHYRTLADPRKRALAELLWRRTTVSQEWIAAKLSMGSAANVSQQLRRRKNAMAKVKLPPELQYFLAEAWESGSCTIFCQFLHTDPISMGLFHP